MTEGQWQALAAFIKSEAKYAADEIMNRNSCGDELRRGAIEDEARAAFLGKVHGR